MIERGFVMRKHPVVSRDDWIGARKALLAKEKAFTRQRDRLSAERRELPWVKVDKEYVFEGAQGKETLADLFAGNSQLLTSCSGRIGPKAVRAARSGQTTTMALPRTCSIAMCRWL